MKKKFDVNDDAQVDKFNELFYAACKQLELPPETDGITYAQAAEILDAKEMSVRRWAYSKPPVLELTGRQYADRGVTLDSVIIYKMTRQHRRK